MIAVAGENAVRCGECGRSDENVTFGEVLWSEAANDFVCLNCADKSAKRQALRSTTTNVDTTPLIAQAVANPDTHTDTVDISEGDEGSEDDGRPDMEVYLAEYAAGRMHPLDVVLPDLPPVAARSNNAQRIVEFYRLCRGLRLEACDDDAVPFGSAWVARKLGTPKVTRRTVSRVLKKLVEAGVLERGEDIFVGKNRVFTYLPARPKGLHVIGGKR